MAPNELMWSNIRSSILLVRPTGVYLFINLPVPVYNVTDILVTFLCAIFWTDFIHCSAVSTVTKLTYSNAVCNNKEVSGKTCIN